MSMAVHVTNHACLRYQERVAPVSIEVARQRLSGAIEIFAANFAAQFEVFIRLPHGQRIVIKDHSVITVLPAEQYRRQVRRIISKSPRSPAA